MAESIIHAKYVEIIHRYIASLINNQFSCFIQLDTSNNSTKPGRSFGNFVPDVYFEHNNCLFIGEAKTIQDIERNHSLSQYKAYIEDALAFKGSAMVVFCVSFLAVPTIKNIIKRMATIHKGQLRIVVLDEYGGEHIIYE